jgi:hypothetical protein
MCSGWDIIMTKAFPRYEDLEIVSIKHTIECFCSLSYLQSKKDTKSAG